MNIKLVTSNIAAAIIAIIGIIAYTGAIGEIPNKDGLALIVGAAVTYLFTENVVNGKSNRASEYV